MPLLAKVEEARQSGDSKTILTLVDDAIAGDPEVERFVGIYKFWALARRRTRVTKPWTMAGTW